MTDRPDRVEMSPETYERAREVFWTPQREMKMLTQMIRQLASDADLETQRFWDETAQQFGYEDAAALRKARKEIRIYWGAKALRCYDMTAEQIRRLDRDDQEGSVVNP